MYRIREISIYPKTKLLLQLHCITVMHSAKLFWLFVPPEGCKETENRVKTTVSGYLHISSKRKKLLPEKNQLLELF